MVPKRKISKGFRERKVPNIEFNSSCRIHADMENLAPNIPVGAQAINDGKREGPIRRQAIENWEQFNKKAQKSSLVDIINSDALKLMKAKMQPELQKDCFLTYQKQLKQYHPKAVTKNKTMQSQDSSLEKFIQNRADKFNSSNKKTDFANKILKSIEASINSSCRSMSAMSKYKKKRKRVIDECKVIKVPWSSNKKQFKPEVSMIGKNQSRAPMDSLREIYQNLN